jgi:hypothetical protein
LSSCFGNPTLKEETRTPRSLKLYFRDPFLAFVYLGSIPFFVALYQALKVLEYIRRDNAFSQAAAASLRKSNTARFIIFGRYRSGGCVPHDSRAQQRRGRRRGRRIRHHRRFRFDRFQHRGVDI